MTPYHSGVHNLLSVRSKKHYFQCGPKIKFDRRYPKHIRSEEKLECICCSREVFKLFKQEHIWWENATQLFSIFKWWPSPNRHNLVRFQSRVQLERILARGLHPRQKKNSKIDHIGVFAGEHIAKHENLALSTPLKNVHRSSRVDCRRRCELPLSIISKQKKTSHV